MGDIERYSFEDADGCEQGFTTFDYREALEHARRHQLTLVANTYEWVDSFAIEDYTPRKRGRRRRVG